MFTFTYPPLSNCSLVSSPCIIHMQDRRQACCLDWARCPRIIRKPEVLFAPSASGINYDGNVHWQSPYLAYVPRYLACISRFELRCRIFMNESSEVLSREGRNDREGGPWGWCPLPPVHSLLLRVTQDGGNHWIVQIALSLKLAKILSYFLPFADKYSTRGELLLLCRCWET